MKRGIIWLLVSCLWSFAYFSVLRLINHNRFNHYATRNTTTATTTAVVTSTTSTAINTTSTTAVTTTTSGTGNWWDSEGTPQYGGTLTVATTTDPAFWDPNQGTLSYSLEFLYLDSMFGANWTTTRQRKTFNSVTGMKVTRPAIC